MGVSIHYEHHAVSTARTLLAGPSYTLSLSTDPHDIESAQRLRYNVFAAEPGFGSAMATVSDGRDRDRFDEYCDHLLVRHNATGDLVGCYRMMPPPGAIAAGGLYIATEFDVDELGCISPQLVEMGRACVAPEHRSGSVMALMWSGILRYLDETGYRYVAGATSVPIDLHDGVQPGSTARAIRDLVRDRHRAPWQVFPHRPVMLDAGRLDDIEPAQGRITMPPLLSGYLRIGAQICGEPAHDVDFGVADFVTVVDKTTANTRYLDRLRSVAESSEAMQR